MSRTALSWLCAALCFMTGTLVAYGLVSSSEPMLMFGIAAGLGAAFVGDRIRRQSESARD